MAKKLIQTNYVFKCDDGEAYGRFESGSYLGKKRATEKTIRRFLNGNRRKHHLPIRKIVQITITDSFESQWIHK